MTFRQTMWGLGLLLVAAALGGWAWWQEHAGDPAQDALEGGLAPAQREQLSQARAQIASALAQVEDAARRQDNEALARAQAAVNAAMGIGTRPTLSPRQIEAALPAALGGLARQPADTFGDDTLGALSVSVSARYGNDEQRRIDMSVSDTGGLSAWAALADWERAAQVAAQVGRREAVRLEGERVVREVTETAETPAQVNLVLANGIVVEAIGDGLTLAELLAVLRDLDLPALEALVPAGSPS
jgi:hypothetical protein